MRAVRDLGEAGLVGIDVHDGAAVSARSVAAEVAQVTVVRQVVPERRERGEVGQRMAGEARERGLENVSFEQRDLSSFDVDAEPEAFAFVTTFDAVHDQARPLAMLRGIRRTLDPDGVYLMQDIQGSSHHHENVDHPGGLAKVTVTH